MQLIRLKIYYDVSLEKEGFEPALYYFNEEDQLLEGVAEQTHENGKVTAHLQHFSRYILLNKTEYDKSWAYTFLQLEEEETFSGLDIAFVIDDSGSMTWNDTENERVTVTQEFIEKLTENDRAAVISFTKSATTLSDFSSDKETLIDATLKFKSSGDTNLSSGIYRALQLFGALEKDDTRLKYIVMLTDGNGSYSTSYSTQALNNHIVIHTIGLGSSVSTSVLSKMAETTGGQYYHVNKASELYYIFDTIAEKSDYYKDSDDDGINDYYEKEMAAGHLVLGNGVQLTSVSYLNPDSDGDGLKDGEEITVSKSGGYVYVKMTSNPGVIDTDGDGIIDREDPYPLYCTYSQSKVVYQTKGKEGISKNPEYEGENAVAEDLTFNDRDFIGILRDCGYFGAITEISPESMLWGEMASLFLLGAVDNDYALEGVLLDLCDEFRTRSSNEGEKVYVGDEYEPLYYHYYINDLLTERVRNTLLMDMYIKCVKNIIINKLKAYNGDLEAVSVKENGGIVSDEINKDLNLPTMELFESVALTLAIHDFQGHNVTVENYVCNGNSFSGTIKFHFYDHFGLDANDYQQIPGFCSWYTLQHFTRFNGRYCPFITIMDMSCDFSGTF